MKIKQRANTIVQGLANAALVAVFTTILIQSSRADDAATILKAMTDYTAA